MKKKVFVLTSAITAIFGFHACTLPTSMIIKGTPNISLPVKIEAEEFNDTIKEVIQNAMEDELEILDYTSFYTSDNKNIKAVLLSFPIIEDHDIGLGNEIEQIKKFDFDLTEDNVSQEFDIGDLKNLNEPMDLIENVELDLSGMFNELQDDINDGFETQSGLSTPFIITGLGDLGDVPDFSAQLISLSVLDTVEFGEGIFYATIRISGPNIPGVNITFSNIRMEDYEGHSVEGVDSITNSTDIILTGANPERIIKFDLAGRTMDKNFEIFISFKNDHSEGPPLYAIPREISVEIIPKSVENLFFKSMTGVILKPTDVKTKKNYQVPVNFPLGSFVHAEIRQGTLDFEVNLPNQPNSTGDSWFSNFDMTPALKILQQHSDPDADGEIWQGLNDSNSLYPNSPDPWNFNQVHNNLNGKHLNTKDVVALSDSSVILGSQGTASFWLNDDDMNEKKVITSILPLLDIDSFAWIHAEIGVELENNKPTVSPIPLGSTSKYLKSIEFNEVGPEFTFGQVDIPDLEIMLSIPELGINPGPYELYKEIRSNTTIDFTNNTPGNTLAIKDNNGNLLIPELPILYDIRPKGGKKVIGLPDLSPSNANLKMEVLNIDFKYNWVHATLDMSSIQDYKNNYPKKGPLDMGQTGKYLKGFLLDYVDAQLYTSGPALFFNLGPKVEMKMNYPDQNDNLFSEDLLGNNVTLSSSVTFELDPDKTGIYSGDMPPGGIPLENFDTILQKEPKTIQFSYQVSLDDEITITPEILDNLELDKKLNAEILFLIPFLLTAGSTGADIVYTIDMTDIMNRDASSEPLPIDFIENLAVKVVLSDEIFTGGYFYLDDGIRRMEYPLSSNSLTLPVTGEDLDYINSTIPYKPEIGVHFAPGDRVQIVRNLESITVDFEAKLKYQIDFNE